MSVRSRDPVQARARRIAAAAAMRLSSGRSAWPWRPAAGTGFRVVFACGEFRALWAAQLLSVTGDQFARVALTVLVFDRTRSALLAAAAYAATIAPVFAGGLLLSGAADRWPRRTVMIACDLARVPLVALMAVPVVPVPALIVLLCAVTALGAPFTSARAATYPEILGDAYPLGSAVTMTTYQAAQVLGFAAAGIVVGFADVRPALLGDAATFLGSAAMIALWVRSRPAPGGGRARPAAIRGTMAVAIRTLRRRASRTPMLLGWLSWAYNVPEALAVPLARASGGGSAAASGIMAAAALGSSAGALAIGRLAAPAARQRMTGPLAFAACAVLTAVALGPGLAGLLVILFACGLCDSYQVQASTSFVTAVPDDERGHAFGLALVGMQLGQGATMIAAGALTQHFGPWPVVAVTGAAGAVAAAVVTLS